MKDMNIVLLNYFTKNDILDAVRSLVADLENCPYDVQITVADNSENKDGIKDGLNDKFPNIKYIDCGGNVGFGRGNNIGFKTADARYYFALNRDTIIPENSKLIERIIKLMDENPRIGCLGPKLLNKDGTLQYSCHRFNLLSMLVKPFKQINLQEKYNCVKKYTQALLMKDFDHNKMRPVDWVSGAAMVVRKEVIDKVGWFDERYFIYLEDADWCRKMWNANFAVYYAPQFVIYHMHARASAKVPGIWRALLTNKLARWHLKSWLQYMWKWRHNHKFYD